MLNRIGLLLPILCLSPSYSGVKWGGDLHSAFDFGGDKIATVTYTNGVTYDLKAGTYFSLGFGLYMIPFQSGSHGIDLNLNTGFGSWSTGPEKTKDRLGLARFPQEMLAHYFFESPAYPFAIKIGGGLGYHFMGKIKGEGTLSNLTTDVDNALGGLGELKFIYKIYALNIRYTYIEYETSQTNAKFDGSSIGVGIGIFFPPAGKR